MIKKPKAVTDIFRKLDSAGYDVYCAGECILAASAGEQSRDWDIYTDCPQEKLTEMFPDGEKLGKRILRIDHTEQTGADEATDNEIIADIVVIEGSIRDQLTVYDYAAEAVAEHPQKKAVDPFGGKEDIQKKLLRPIGDVSKSFERNPVSLLKPIRYAAVYNFDMSRELSEIVTANHRILEKADKEDILEEFTAIMTGKYAGKALKMLAGLDLLQYIVGAKAARTTRAEAKDYYKLADNIDKTMPVPLRRLGLFYLRFPKNYKNAIEYLPHDEQSLEYLLIAKNSIRSIYFINNDIELKRYIHRHGWDKYNYIDKLQKAEATVFNSSKQKIEGRDYILRIVKERNDPIFTTDLVIDANDIMEAGITDDAKRAEWLLSLLPDVVHRKPADNDRKILLKCARVYNRNRFRRAFRDVTWLR